MGAWGEGPFENDDAGDWAWELDGLDRAAGLELLESAFGAVNGAEYVEAPDGAVAVAAAQVVAWLQRPEEIPDSPYGESAATWVRATGGPPDPTLVAAARQALQRVQADGSELAELWDETGDGAWRVAAQQLAATLT